jgi:ASC-1-like (ASCH) protein
MQWMSDEEYIALTGLDLSAIEDLIQRGKLTIKVEDGVRYIDPSKGTSDVVPAKLQELSSRNTHEMMVQPEFIEKTIGTIINLHEKVLDSKDETIEAVKVENTFLREALSSLQELYDEDRKTIAALTEQLKLSQQEVEFMRRKYKLMWNKAIDEHTN